MSTEERPDPETFLERLRDETPKAGRLKIYLGYAAGVGKTYAMLDDAREQWRNGVDVLIGYIEPHVRPETLQLLEGLQQLAPRAFSYRNMQLKEFDLNEALARKPSLILIDELAHTNVIGARNRKRYQDVEELLAAGIDVYTTVNVQHLESLNDVVENITHVRVQETVPDKVFDSADQVRLIDIEPDELLSRFRSGKVYRPTQAETAMRNFFTQENLKLLREIALRKVADHITFENQHERRMAEKMASTKILVCIGSSPSSERCLRWAARAAEAFHSPWEALYVESIESASMTDGQQNGVRNNLDLAARLGAQTTTLSGNDVATVVAEYARLSGVTNIVIGKNRNRRTIRTLFETDMVDKLISLLPNIEVHIIPAPPVKGGYRSPRKVARHRRFHLSGTDCAAAFGSIVAATLLSMLLRYIGIDEQNVIMVYLLSVLIASCLTKGYVYGIGASVLSVLAFNFFFTEPYLTFETIQPGYPLTFLIMLIVALIASALTARIKKQTVFAVEREHRTDVLYEINKQLLATRGADNIIRMISAYIVKLFSRSFIFYTKDPEQGAEGSMTEAPDDNGAFLLSLDEKAVAHWVFLNQKRAGSGTDTLMGAGALYMPVISQGKVLAVWGISCQKEPLDHGNRLFLRMIASQTAMALERQQLSDQQRSTQMESERERMRATLLRAISHDLRTPLAGIFGASSALRESKTSLTGREQDKLLSDIQEEAQWLIRMVENLLAITRINETTTKVVKTPEAAEEIVAEAVSRILRRFSNREIIVRVPSQLLEVPMDGTLMVQVLINLLENALKYSPPTMPVEIVLHAEGKQAVFEVLDRGGGIPSPFLPWQADSGISPSANTSDKARGMGIGLTICETIVKAHGGKLNANTRDGGGSVFKVTLPLSEED